MSDDLNQNNPEYKNLMKVLNFRLPHSYKKIGFICALGLFIFLIVFKFVGSNSLLVKDIIRTAILLCLLVCTLARERVEDEFINHIRLQSYVLAFTFAIAYSICLPLITVVLDVLITNIRGEGTISFHETSAFEVMFMLVCFQLLFFATLKRLNCA